ncbi:hypothetical protein Cni_G21381 [Canna indica]|uniref:Uncharacterized protein n=1 Tax=Canna indica TaxID=4628 RepID=A0AAQ3QIM9_9LILI|nr:hypothetical protein Cni_G21381 [Canna indica]
MMLKSAVEATTTPSPALPSIYAFSDDIKTSSLNYSMDEEPSPTTNHGEDDVEEEEEQQEILNTTPSSPSTDWLQLGLAVQTSNSGASSSSSTAASVIQLLPRPMTWGIWRPRNWMSSGGGILSAGTAVPVPPSPLRMDMGIRLKGSSSTMLRAGAASGMRVVSPPRRQSAGVWLILEAAQHQGRQPFLPQIPNNYLRIKDGRLTVKLLIKYLVRKLGLEDESEVEITCRGQRLLPFLTLQYVRDSIWCLSNNAAMWMLPDSPAATQHVMQLQYRRRAHPFLGLM